MNEMEESLTLSRDIKRACELLEKLQKSKYCGEVSNERVNEWINKWMVKGSPAWLYTITSILKFWVDPAITKMYTTKKNSHFYIVRQTRYMAKIKHW
jgi:hypothetical protein